MEHNPPNNAYKTAAALVGKVATTENTRTHDKTPSLCIPASAPSGQGSDSQLHLPANTQRIPSPNHFQGGPEK
jgi:hypothetical protein